MHEPQELASANSGSSIQPSCPLAVYLRCRRPAFSSSLRFINGAHLPRPGWLPKHEIRAGCARFGRVAHPFLFLLFDGGARLNDTTPVRQRRVTGFAFPGGRPFAFFEGSGFWCFLSSMANKLIRIYGRGHLHFITFSCDQREPFLRSVRAKNVFVQMLGDIRDRYGFSLVGYVDMPKHVYLLIGESVKGTP